MKKLFCNHWNAGALVMAPAILCFMFAPSPVASKVVRVEVTNREVVSALPDYGTAGPYEIITGVIYLEVDPMNPANQSIVDLKLAPTNDRGTVEFSTEFELHKPVDARRGNRRLMYFVNNRGYKIGAGHFCFEAGGNWLYRNGWSYLWCGWNCDVQESGGRFNIHVPVATQNGETITGRIYAEMISYANDTVYSLPIVWGGSVAYEPVDMNDPQAVLTMRQYRWEEPIEIPRNHWRFAHVEDEQVVPDPGSIYIQEGFRPGWLYDLVYVGKDPMVTGLGMAAIRDVVSFFKHEEVDEAVVVNPLADVIEYVYAWGHSQSGRLLNHFVYQNFDGDEEGRMVFDGIMSNCPGGGKGQFNSRFAQFTRHGSHHEDNLFPIDFFPLATVEQHDPVTGKRGDAFARARESGFLPKMFYINSSTDYWTRAASLLHTDVEGKRDIQIDPNVRMYLVAGITHVDGRIGILGRALLTALDQWVSDGTVPPESRIPRVADGTLVTLEAWRNRFPAIPGVPTPPSFYHPYRLDPGPRWDSEGIADIVPPATGPRYVCLVPQVDEDGNEIAGIRLPDVAVPPATYAGWTMRNPAYSLTLGRNTGRTWAFPSTESRRIEAGDPRKSIAERYSSKEDFLFRVTESLLKLREERLLLDEDFSSLLDKAFRRSAFLDELRTGNLRSVTDVAIEEGAAAGLAYLERLGGDEFVWWYGIGQGRLEATINAAGYGLMAEAELDDALEVFKLNTLIFPRSANTWDSLAECYYNRREFALSVEFYNKSLELNPGNTNALIMLRKIEEERSGGD